MLLFPSASGSLTQKDAACRGACCAGIRGRVLEHREKWISDQPVCDARARARAGSRRITTHRSCSPAVRRLTAAHYSYLRVFEQIGIKMQDIMKYQGISDRLAIVARSGFIAVFDTRTHFKGVNIAMMVSFAFNTRTFYFLSVVCSITNAVVF
ncbi:uncharacterized protein LY79DRAFT_593445 [Colletotrichum navitas]|uniref:Uncharacterized protein n=1 Tax=Colletotrichum navitas TaxID=681940 RepID=A0AAD8UZX9_9PEZI|nr:uncharacterized protein LY79DRAFT_593445 [Colletotrichum navitas]KAK1574167.1 hypothetical protein LY79DRAFT_593445 [Colletotrichum navitas]